MKLFILKKNRPTKLDVSQMGQWDLIGLRFKKHKPALVSLILLCGMYFMALFAEFFAPNDPLEKNIQYRYAGPMFPQFSFSQGLYVYGIEQRIDPVTKEVYYVRNRDYIVPLKFFVRGSNYRMLGLISSDIHFFGVDKVAYKKEHGIDADSRFFLFGGDKFGQCLLSRIIKGGQISLSIGIVSIIISFFLGIGIGGVSGYFGGLVDAFIQRGIEIINAFPKLPLWLALGAALPRTWSNMEVYLGITVILSLMGWTWMARVVRGKILSLREEDYAVAANLIGASHSRVIFRHLVPGFTSHIIVSLTLSVPTMILGETALSFLGLGLQSPTISWGVMLQDCMSMQVVMLYPWLLLPVGAIILAVMAFNFLGDGVRDAADPYSSR